PWPRRGAKPTASSEANFPSAPAAHRLQDRDPVTVGEGSGELPLAADQLLVVKYIHVRPGLAVLIRQVTAQQRMAPYRGVQGGADGRCGDREFHLSAGEIPQ